MSADKQIEIDPNKVYIIVHALTWEQMMPAGDGDKKLYGRSAVYGGNSNGDFFEGGRNVLWRCNSCRKAFLKYPELDKCVHCGSPDVNDWTADVTGKQGELFSRCASGQYMYETWRGKPLFINHDESAEAGTIEDVWPETADNSICELISVDRRKNDRIARKVEAGQISETSMGVLVGSSLCGHCGNQSSDERDWCSCLKDHKGRIHPRTGRRVFEILRNCQGAEHSLIAVGYGADEHAKIKLVLASANPPANTGAEPSSTTFLGSTQETDMPEIGLHGNTVAKADRSITAKTVADRRGGMGGGGGGASVGGLIRGAMNQLQEYGNIDSSRIAGKAVEAAVAATQREMTPQNPQELRRVIEAQIKQLALTDPNGAQLMKAALRAANPPKPWKTEASQIKSALRPIAAAIGGQRVASALTSLSDPQKIKAILTAAACDKRSGALAVAASGMMDDATDAQIARIVSGALSDGLSSAAEAIGSEISALVEQSVSEAIEGLTGDSFAEKDLGRDLDKPEGGEVHEIPADHTDAVITVEDADGKPEDNDRLAEDPDSLEAKPDMNTRTAQLNAPKNPEHRDATTESFPSTPGKADKGPNKVDRMEDNRSPKTEDVPASNLDAKPNDELASGRVAQINHDNPAEPDAAPSTAAENPKGKTEKFPDPLEKPEVSIKPRSTALEDMAKPKAKAAGAEINKVGAPAAKTLKAESTPGSDLDAKNANESATPPPSQDSKPKAETFPFKAVASLPLPSRLAMAVDPACPANIRGALRQDPSADVRFLAAQLKDPTYPDKESLDGKDGKTKMIDATKPNPDLGQDNLTTSNDDYPNKLAGGDKPQGSSDTYPNKLAGGDKLTTSDPRYKDGKNVEEKGEGPKTTKNEDRPDDLSLDAAKVTASLVELKGPGKRSASYWEVCHAGKPIMRVTAKAAFGADVIDNWEVCKEDGGPGFITAAYRDTLVSHIAQFGPAKVNQDVFGGEAEVIRPVKAQGALGAAATPTPNPGNGPSVAPTGATPAPATPPPANLDPSTSADLQATNPDAAPLTSTLAKCLAPIVAGDQYRDPQAFTTDLVGLFGDQEKVTEFTTKLAKEVEDLQPSKVGADAGADQSAGGTMGANPNLVPATGPLPATESRPMVGASRKEWEAKITAMVRSGTLDEEAAAYFRKAYPEGYGSELVSVANKTGARTAMAQENETLKTERRAMLMADRAMDMARKAQIAGLIPCARDFIGQGMEREAARQASKDERQAEAKRLMALSDEAFGLICQRYETAHKRHEASLAKREDVPSRVEAREDNARTAAANLQFISASQQDGNGDLEVPSAPSPRLAGVFSSAVDTDVIDADRASGGSLRQPARRRR